MIKINMDRLVSNLQTLGKIGLNESGGLDRTAFTDAELQARNWLFEKLNAINLTVKVDEIANIWAKREGSNPKYPSIVFGSHIDSVPNGGKYDGALGVLMALEVMQTLEENGIQTTYPLELVSFSAEEANPFGVSTLGSRAAAGKLKQQDIFNAINDEGMTLTQALQKAGGDPVHFEKAKRNPNELAAYLEVHIEQGKRLLNREIPVGIVTGITGIYREQVTVSGEANHAGTTLMKDRTDALMQASEMMLAFETAVKDYPDEELVGTIGKIENYPNAANVIPGQVELHIEIRGGSRDAIQDVINKWEKKLEEIRQRRNGKVHRHVTKDQLPVTMDPILMDTSEQAATKFGYATMRLGSMAGHDAAHMATLTKAGMLFVPSIDGKSHCPEEESRKSDIEIVCNTLLHSILLLDQQLSKQFQLIYSK